MAKTDDASKPIPSRSAAATPAPAASLPTLEAALTEAIEEERARLMQVEALLDCVLVAMDNDEVSEADDPYYPSVIELARELVNKSIAQLDGVKLQPLIRQITGSKPYHVGEEGLGLGFGRYMVREADVVYSS